MTVTAPLPWAEPVARPSGAGGGVSARPVAVDGLGAGGGVLATAGSSLSDGFGSPGARGGSVRSGSTRSGNAGARAGISGSVGAAGRGVWRSGSSLGVRGAGRGGGSSARGGNDVWPCGEPTAATAGTRFTT